MADDEHSYVRNVPSINSDHVASLSFSAAIYNISSIGKKHIFRGFMCFPDHVSEVKNL